MTRREEEIEQAAFSYIMSDVVSAENTQLAFGDFINGAKWADKTMIDKATEWLFKHVFYYPEQSYMVEMFRKAMEE